MIKLNEIILITAIALSSVAHSQNFSISQLNERSGVYNLGPEVDNTSLGPFMSVNQTNTTGPGNTTYEYANLNCNVAIQNNVLTASGNMSCNLSDIDYTDALIDCGSGVSFQLTFYLTDYYLYTYKYSEGSQDTNFENVTFSLFPFVQDFNPTSLSGSGSISGMTYGVSSIVDFECGVSVFERSAQANSSGQANLAFVFVYSQSPIITGTISGCVRDILTGLTLSNATVQIGPFTDMTDADGNYSQSGLPAGSYTVITSATNYFSVTNVVATSSTQSNLILNVNLISMNSNVAKIVGTITSVSDGSPIAGASIQMGTNSATSGNGGKYSISNIPPATYLTMVSKTNYYTLTTNLTISSSTTVTQNFSLTPLPVLSVSLFRVALPQANVNISDAIDAPIVPVVYPTVLANASPLGMGVVADGVTPVLLQFSGTPTNYTLRVTHNAPGYLGSITSHLFVLQGNSWSPTTNLSISLSSAPAYAYLSGLNWTDFIGAPANGVTVTVSAFLPGETTAVATTNIFVRPVPIILVHGIASTAESWDPAFTNQLAINVPADFIQAITYGEGSGFNQLWPSCSSSLTDLAKEVDNDLYEVETQWHQNWAFTRYDVVGHSQGGVLLRMLCQISGASTGPFTSSSFPVVNAANFYRGRFRRVVTIGSPQNGSLLLYYIDEMQGSLFQLDRELAEIPYFVAPAVEKFDPSRSQIQFINNSFPIDQRIPFHCIQSTIDLGNYPVSNPFKNPFVYNVLGLQNILLLGPNAGKTRGQVLIPSGSDGIVDFASQGGGTGTKATNDFNTVSHAGPEWLFGVPITSTETTSAAVGADVANLLSGPASNFGPFVIPQPLTESQLAVYNQVVPNVQTIFGAIIQAFTSHIPSTNINYRLIIPSNLPLDGSVNWMALDYGTNGISTNGAAILVDTNDSTQVTLSIATGVTGQIVLTAEYMTTNGNLIFADPIVALTVPSSSGVTVTNIELQPQGISLNVGDSMSTQILGDNSDGSKSYLYTSLNQVKYTSSNPSVATVDSNGTIKMNAFGTAVIFAYDNGFSAKTVVSTPVPSISYLAGVHNINGTFQLSVASTVGTTNVVEASTNLVKWVPIATLYNTNGFLQFLDVTASNYSVRFYRVLINNVGSTNILPFIWISSQSRLTNGAFQCSLTGTSGVTNIVQASTNLTSWFSLQTILNTNGTVFFVDQSATNAKQKFYRVVIPQ